MLKAQFSLTEIKKTKYFREVVELERSLFTSTLERIYSFDTNLRFVVLINNFDNVIGYLVYKDHDIAYDIFKIGVKETYKNKGYGYELLKTIFDKDVILEVKCTNDVAINFYHKHGFKDFEVMAGYYEGVDGIKMIRRH